MHWYKRDPHAAIEGMLGLTMEERGAYNTLIDLLMARDLDVPNDDAFMAVAQQCNPRTWRRLRDSLIAKGKVRITPDGKLTANRVEYTLNEARMFSERQSNRAKKRYETTTDTVRPRSANTSTTTKKDFLSSSVTTSEHLQPSAELLEHERKKRPAPGSLATAPFDSALARPAYAPTVPSKGDRLDRPFTRAEVGKPNGWDWDDAPKKAAEIVSREAMNEQLRDIPNETPTAQSRATKH